MAYSFIMLPDGVTGTNNWLNNEPATCGSSDVDNDNGETQYCIEATNGHVITFTMADPSIPESDIYSITSVQVKMKAKSMAGYAYVDVYQTGTDINNYIQANDRINTSNTSDYELISAGLKETIAGVGTPSFTYTDLKNLQVKLDKFRTSGIKISYLYVEVIYVPYTKISIPSGKLTLNGGNFIIK